MTRKLGTHLALVVAITIGPALACMAGDLSHLPPGAIIDLHCHVAGIGAGGSGCFISEALRHNWRWTPYLRAFGVKEADLVAQGDSLIVRKLSDRLAGSREVQAAVVLAVDGAVDEKGELDPVHTEYYVPNDYVWRQTRGTRNLLYGASINPMRRDAMAILNREARRGAVLVKWLPNIQGFSPSDLRCVPFYRRLAALRMPLLVHTGNEHSFSTTRDELGDPARLELALQCGVTVIAAHAGGAGRSAGERNLDRFVALLRRYPNLYGDISALTLLNHAGHLRRLLRTPGVADHLVFGTDTPLLETPLTSPWFSLFTIGPAAVWRVSRERNPWDEAVAYLRALGVPPAVFTRGASLLRHPG